jgi:hypothetical protein
MTAPEMTYSEIIDSLPFFQGNVWKADAKARETRELLIRVKYFPRLSQTDIDHLEWLRTKEACEATGCPVPPQPRRRSRNLKQRLHAAANIEVRREAVA